MSYVDVIDRVDIPKPKKNYTEPQWIDVAGLPVAYRRKGKGEPVLFLHGGGFTRMWLPLYEEMSKGCDFIAPEHPGMGETPVASWINNFDDLTIHYDDFLNGLGLDKIHLVGYSMGGWAASEIATFYPGRLKSLTLITPIGLRIDDPGVDMFQLGPSEMMDRLFNDKKVMAEYAPDPNDFDEAIQIYSEMSAMATLIWAPRYNLALERRLKRVKCPALVVKAENDRLVPNAMAEKFAAAIPNAKQTTIKETGHELCLERPAPLAAALLDHIKGASK